MESPLCCITGYTERTGICIGALYSLVCEKGGRWNGGKTPPAPVQGSHALKTCVTGLMPLVTVAMKDWIVAVPRLRWGSIPFAPFGLYAPTETLEGGPKVVKKCNSWASCSSAGPPSLCFVFSCCFTFNDSCPNKPTDDELFFFFFLSPPEFSL